MVCLALGIFVADCLTPRGTGMGSLYILVVVTTLPLKNPSATKIATIGSILLLFLGYWVSSPRPVYETAMLNPWISMIGMMITAFMVIHQHSAQQALLQTLKEDLAVKYGLPTQELNDQNPTLVNPQEEDEIDKDRS